MIGSGNRKELSARSYPVYLGRMKSMRIKILHLNHVTLERLLNRIFIFRWLRIVLKSGSSEGLTSRGWNYMRCKCCWSLRFSVENLFFERPTLQLRETDWINWRWIVLFFKNDSSSNITSSRRLLSTHDSPNLLLVLDVLLGIFNCLHPVAMIKYCASHYFIYKTLNIIKNIYCI